MEKPRCSSRARLAVLGIGFIASISAESTESLKGCYPITLDDVAQLNPPTFAQYPAARVDLKPSKVDIASNPLARRFRTMIRMQAPKGPNFAGHYTIAYWGCGVACIRFAIIDAATGTVYSPPQRLKYVTADHVSFGPNEPRENLPGLRYEVDSRLLIVLGAPNEDDAREGIAYYQWTGKSLQPVRWFKSNKAWCAR